MSFAEQIEELWNNSDDNNLGSVMQEIINLLDAAHDAQEELPLGLELNILLNANYALGFGGQVTEARTLALLLDRILNSDQDLPSAKVHRLGCTLTSAVISIMTSDSHHNARTAYDIIVWEDLQNETDLPVILGSLSKRIVDTIKYGRFDNWQLELYSFLITLILLQEDLGHVELNETYLDKIPHLLEGSDRESQVWENWEREWLDKSDYYRFVTLVLTNSSVNEDVWMEKIKGYLS